MITPTTIPTTDDLHELKRRARAAMAQTVARELQEPGRRDLEGQWAAALVYQLLQWQQARGVLVSYAMAQELPTEPIIATALATRRRVALPRLVRRGVMEFRLWNGDPALLQPHPFGMLQPVADARCPVWSIADGDAGGWICLVPAVAFDEHRRRLGHGGGYYDHFIAGVRRELRRLPAEPRQTGPAPALPMIGLGFSFQLLPEVPVTAGDEPVDLVIAGDCCY